MIAAPSRKIASICRIVVSRDGAARSHGIAAAAGRCIERAAARRRSPRRPLPLPGRIRANDGEANGQAQGHQDRRLTFRSRRRRSSTSAARTTPGRRPSSARPRRTSASTRATSATTSPSTSSARASSTRASSTFPRRAPSRRSKSASTASLALVVDEAEPAGARRDRACTRRTIPSPASPSSSKATTRSSARSSTTRRPLGRQGQRPALGQGRQRHPRRLQGQRRQRRRRGQRPAQRHQGRRHLPVLDAVPDRRRPTSTSTTTPSRSFGPRRRDLPQTRLFRRGRNDRRARANSHFGDQARRRATTSSCSTARSFYYDPDANGAGVRGDPDLRDASTTPSSPTR